MKNNKMRMVRYSEGALIYSMGLPMFQRLASERFRDKSVSRNLFLTLTSYNDVGGKSRYKIILMLGGVQCLR